MATDFDAFNVTINYTGGSITLPAGNAKSLFGDDGYELLRPEGEEVTISKKAHTRTPVIGGPSTNVDATTYTYTKWPRSSKSNSAGGQEIVMAWEGSEGNWVARMDGSASDLGTFLNASSPKPVTFATAGSNYGPFVMSSIS
jgi:hypothetical protein